MSRPSNDVFVSYRRKVNGVWAEAIWQRLTAAGIDAFYDIESVRAGRFDDLIFSEIVSRPYFLLVLTPRSLAGCTAPTDWVRREIECALESDRVIIPCHTPEFSFDEVDRCLPDLSEQLRGFERQEISPDWFKYAIQHLVEQFLTRRLVEEPARSTDAHQVAGRIRAVALDRRAVGSVELAAQALFDRAFGRPESEQAERIADYTALIDLDPTYLDAHFNRAVAKCAVGDRIGALDDYTEAIRQVPSADAFWGRAVAKFDLGDLSGAIADYTEAIRFDPTCFDAVFGRAAARDAACDWVGSTDDYTQAIRLNPTSADAFYGRGAARAELGEHAAAIDDYTSAIALRPDHADALYNRGLEREQVGDTVGALADLRRYQSLVGGDDDLRQWIERLEIPPGDRAAAT